MIDEDNPSLQVVIVINSRELACQINSIALALSTYMKVKIMLLTGSPSGLSFAEVKQKSKEGAQLGIATPKRLMEIAEKKLIDLSQLKLLIMDECDEMLAKNFCDDMGKVLMAIPINCQIGMFSATMTSTFLNHTKSITKDPVYILLNKDQVMPEGIKQYKTCVRKEDEKLFTLVQIQKSYGDHHKIIFCKTRDTVCKIVEEMKHLGISVSSSIEDLQTENF